VDLKSRSFELMLGRPVQFPLFSTTSDRIDRPGDILEIGDEFRALPPIHTLFKGARSKKTTVPVHLRATLTELGTLELWCVSNDGEDRWRLEFELRGATAHAAATVTESMPARFDEVRAVVERVFGNQPLPAGSKEVKQLSRTLEKTIGPRDGWRLPLLRELWSDLYAGANRRRRSADHERVFFQLAGYSLRPGFGYPLDEWRCGQMFLLFKDSVKFHAEQPIWSEFWVMWRPPRRRAGRGSNNKSCGTISSRIWFAAFRPHHRRTAQSQKASSRKALTKWCASRRRWNILIRQTKSFSATGSRNG